MRSPLNISLNTQKKKKPENKKALAVRRLIACTIAIL